jgi:prephenate dehydratase
MSLTFSSNHSERYKKPHPNAANGKSALIVSIPDRLGGLHAILQVVSECGLNMVSIESRPSTTPKNDYDFFIEFANADDANLKKFEHIITEKNFGDVHTVMASNATKDQGMFHFESP